MRDKTSSNQRILTERIANDFRSISHIYSSVFYTT